MLFTGYFCIPKIYKSMKKVLIILVSLLTLSISAREFKDIASAQAAQINRVGKEDIQLVLPRFIFSHTNTKITIKFKNPAHDKLVSNGYKLHFIVNGNDQVVEFDQEGEGSVTSIFTSDNKLSVLFEDASFTEELSVISIWYMVLPLAGLFLFLGYRLTFSRKKMTLVSNRDVTSQKASLAGKVSNLKLVKEEEEVMA